MGGRELKEDVKKLQSKTGASYDICYEAFVKAAHNLDKAIILVNTLTENNLFNNFD